jgi:hypothetical protein
MDPTNKSSGELTADTLITTGKAVLAGVQIITDGTNDATLVIYDNTAASGTEVFKQVVAGADLSLPFWFSSGGIRCDTGMYCDVTGTGASYIVYFR